MMIPSQSYFFLFASLILYTLASPNHQRDALVEFRNEFPVDADPQFYDNLTSWNTSSDFCSWKGVTCDAESGEVVSLVLDSIFLNNSLKSNSSLFKLQHLRRLSLTSCNLIGEIPYSLGNLSHLTDLDLSSNYLVGEIPSSVGNLKQLSGLSLSDNNLVGKIPSSLGNLSRLTDLLIAKNHLIGEVPSSIGNLNQLTYLSFTSNNLSGNIPISFANFNKLSYLHLDQNQFSCIDFPRILPNLTSLSELYLYNNHFKSTLPSDMNRNTSSSSSIGTINLSHNNFYGPIPEFISGFPNLFHIDLSHNGFIGPIPRSMSKLVSLSYLDLSYNKLEGQVPSFLWRLYSLKLAHNSFSSLEKSVDGSHFDLGSNSLPRLFPHWNCKFRSRDFSNNHLTDSIPSCLMNSSTSLGYLNLRNNNISGLLPDIFINATELETLDVSHNQLVGKLPKSLMSCKKMKFLNLKGNKIKDTFPSWLESLESLSVLLLGSNAFYGPIYSASGFPTLQVMDISHNIFNGTLPQDYFVNWLEMSSVDKIESYELPNGTFSLEIGSSVYMGNDVYGYEDSMDMIYKGVETEFSRIFRGYKAIDFSGNRFKGWIPHPLAC